MQLQSFSKISLKEIWIKLGNLKWTLDRPKNGIFFNLKNKIGRQVEHEILRSNNQLILLKEI